MRSCAPRRCRHGSAARTATRIATRRVFIRERDPPRRIHSAPVQAGPGFRKDPGLFVFRLSTDADASAPACDIGRTRRLRRAFFNNLPQDPPGIWPRAGPADAELTLADRVRSVPWRVPGGELCFTSGVPMHSEAASRGVGGPGCARPQPGHVQRDTTSDGTLACGHSRSEFFVAFVQSAEDTGLSFRERGFESRTRYQTQEPSSSLRFEGGNRPRRLGGAGTRARMEFASLAQR